MGVRAMPTFILFRGGLIAGQTLGADRLNLVELVKKATT